MRLTHLLNKQIVIARMAVVSGDKIAFSTVTAEMGHIQPMDSDKTEIESGIFGKTFRVYMEGDTDIQEGDRLRDDSSNYYTVKSDGVSRRTFGSIDYIIAILEKTN